MNWFGHGKLGVTARFRQAHNLKVVGSNPAPTMKNYNYNTVTCTYKGVATYNVSLNIAAFVDTLE